MITKIARPKMSDIYPRHRVFEKMGADVAAQQILWVAGPPGAGKTTLAASYLETQHLEYLWYQIDEGDEDLASFFYYMGLAAKAAVPEATEPLPLLTPEHLSGLPVFTRRYFETLFRIIAGRHSASGAGGEFVIVLDNYQKVPVASAFHEMLVNGLDMLPDGIRVIIVSRLDPPPHFARMCAQNRIKCLGWDDIRLTLDESKGITRTIGQEALDTEALMRLHAVSEGWAAGLILLFERFKKAGFDIDLFDTLPRETVFTYFAGEVFHKADEATRDFQMRTAFLPQMTARMAERLSGHPDAQGMLDGLHRDHFFIERRLANPPLYSYHALFREFLILQAEKTYAPELVRQIKGQAAGLLEGFDLIEDAAELYLQTSDWPGLERLILKWAPQLISQGRNRTLEKWIRSLLETAGSSSLVLQYWLGIARLANDPVNARADLESAFAATADSDPLKLLIWSAIVDTYCLEWNDFGPLDSWIDWMEAATAAGIEFAGKEIEARVVTSMSKALMLRRPHHPEIVSWTGKALAAAREFADVNFRVQQYLFIAFFYFWRGDLARFRALHVEIESLVTLPEATPLTRLARPCIEAFIDIWLEGAYEKAMDKIDGALRYAEETGVYIWNHMFLSMRAYCALSRGEVAFAEQSLTALTALLDGSRKHLYCQYYYLLSWASYLKGEKAVARVQAATALEYAETTGYVFPLILCLIQSAWVVNETGESDNARVLLNRAKTLCRQTSSRVMGYAAALVEAGLLMGEGRQDDGLAVLEQGLAVGEVNGYLTPPWWCDPPFMADLCAKALEYGIGTRHVTTIICRRRLLADRLGKGLGHKWPWPVKVTTLGRFELLRWAQPVVFSGKVQKKPLEMLKVLIALGPKNVRKEQVTDILWPDADGDVAHKSFATTLHRLRQLLGDKRTVMLHEGQVCLDPCFCWVDAFCFLEDAARIEQRWSDQPEPAADIVAHAEMTLELYNGPFLEGDTEPWAIAFRDRLKNKCRRILLRLAKYREQAGAWELAVRTYERILEVDPFAESVYQELMLCYHRTGRSGEVVRTYRRCRRTMVDAFGIEPSDTIQQLFQCLCSDESKPSN